MPEIEVELLISVLVESDLDLTKKQFAKVAQESVADGLNKVYHRHGFAHNLGDNGSITIQDVEIADDYLPEKPEKIDPKQKYYLDNAGNICPYCHSGNIEGGSFETDSGVASQKMDCNDCDAEWEDNYDLIGFQKE